jgi:myosin X
VQGGTIKKGSNLSDAEIAKVKGKIVDEWRKLKGLDKNGARLQYMELIQSWDGYGSNLFEVEQTSNKHWPKELWLAISLNGVGIYVRGEYVASSPFLLCPISFVAHQLVVFT